MSNLLPNGQNNVSPEDLRNYIDILSNLLTHPIEDYIAIANKVNTDVKDKAIECDMDISQAANIPNIFGLNNNVVIDQTTMATKQSTSNMIVNPNLCQTFLQGMNSLDDNTATKASPQNISNISVNNPNLCQTFLQGMHNLDDNTATTATTQSSNISVNNPNLCQTFLQGMHNLYDNTATTATTQNIDNISVNNPNLCQTFLQGMHNLDDNTATTGTTQNISNISINNPNLCQTFFQGMHNLDDNTKKNHIFNTYNNQYDVINTTSNKLDKITFLQKINDYLLNNMKGSIYRFYKGKLNSIDKQQNFIRNALNKIDKMKGNKYYQIQRLMSKEQKEILINEIERINSDENNLKEESNKLNEERSFYENKILEFASH
ncbi:hypothetical protein H8356DRAFT_1432176 [Neocallimastix lanati (nom. inval.)]|nr:hypothetical protein H8356DRAFT_1432176 [Neocallimastix sp. JGI-2020a]